MKDQREKELLKKIEELEQRVAIWEQNAKDFHSQKMTLADRLAAMNDYCDTLHMRINEYSERLLDYQFYAPKHLLIVGPGWNWKMKINGTINVVPALDIQVVHVDEPEPNPTIPPVENAAEQRKIQL